MFKMEHFYLRLGINRDNSIVTPGIYSSGKPSKSSPVFVSANYVMSFNYLRSSLKNIDAWIMVINTRGINVWCAAGKKTFGTQEIISCINKFNLNKLVDHKNIIVPQLGASGVSAFEVKKNSGFNVIYGPVNAKDIPEFVDLGFKATKKMRTIRFDLWDRVVLIPIEITQILKYLIPACVLLYFVSTTLMYALLLSVVSGLVITPILLPYIPFRSFILKGAFIGTIIESLLLICFSQFSAVGIIGSIMLFSSISAYLAFNFTGCTTFTSPSGVYKELEKYIKPLIYTGVTGLIIVCVHIVRSFI